MEQEYNENLLDYWKLANGNYIVKIKKDVGLEGDIDVKTALPSPLGAFVLKNSKCFMNDYKKEINGF